jgi:hypothetical protein
MEMDNGFNLFMGKANVPCHYMPFLTAFPLDYEIEAEVIGFPYQQKIMRLT